MAAFTSTTAAASPTPCRPAALVARSSAASGSSRWAAPLRSAAPVVVGLRRAAAPSRRGATLRVRAKKQTFSSFDELLEKSEKPVLVDFYATWCGPCQYMVPILQEVSEKLGDKIQIVKIDTEKYTSIANRYQIEALPTFIIFKNGKPCHRFEGALPANQLIQQIESALEVAK
uniref:Thioredoxin domain-containing protein n=1 Tax=Oryza punctata TaxID=4537 RepID=A0A0E0JTZ7_ORYPU